MTSHKLTSLTSRLAIDPNFWTWKLHVAVPCRCTCPCSFRHYSPSDLPSSAKCSIIYVGAGKLPNKEARQTGHGCEHAQTAFRGRLDNLIAIYDSKIACWRLRLALSLTHLNCRCSLIFLGCSGKGRKVAQEGGGQGRCWFGIWQGYNLYGDTPRSYG